MHLRNVGDRNAGVFEFELEFVAIKGSHAQSGIWPTTKPSRHTQPLETSQAKARLHYTMAAPRLPFLWPILFKTAEIQPSLRSARAAARFRAYRATPAQRQQETIPQRYGSANEPPPHLGGGRGFGPPIKQAQEQTKLPKIGEKLQKDGEQEVKADRADRAEEKAAQQSKEPATVDESQASPIRGDPMLDASESHPPKEPPSAPRVPEDKPLDSLLDAVPGPSEHQRETKQEKSGEEHDSVSFDEHSPPIRAPHIDTPRYVHHFDTYGLVKRLEEGGWDEVHAVTIMKAVRLMLADNMDLAREALVSKSMVENETYLFRAACAELKTEVTSRRKAEQEKMRTERAQLQHEVDILGQRMSQESAGLKDDLKGMFDDRKMAVRNEQRGMESKVQQLNYKITVNLQADAKSEVEGLRWVMTRRVIIALFVVVMMVVGSLKLYSNAVHDQEVEAKRRANMRSGGTQTDSGAGGDSYGGRRGHSHVAGEMLVRESDNPGYVSLG